MTLKSWIKQVMPGRVFTQDASERYIHQDFDIPPDPQVLVRIGMFSTIDAANQAIAKDKSLWGGARNHMSLDEVQNAFGSQFPAAVPFGGKPAVHAKLTSANRPMVPDPNDPTKTIPGDLGYQAVLDEWKSRGLIT